MGTRGAIGFILDGEEKITYNHFDSYPDQLGKNVLKFLSETSIDEMKTIFKNIEVVDEQSKPTEKQIKHCKPWTNLGVGGQSIDDWYCITREAQGDFDAYKNGLKYMIDGRDFLLDSLFCEYAYIINLNTEKLEYYLGFQKESGRGR